MHVDLEITYRNGSPRLGYLYLSAPSEKSAHSHRVSPAMVIDVNKDGQLIGIELLDPSQVTLESVNNVLKEHGMAPLKESHLKPLLAA